MILCVVFPQVALAAWTSFLTIVVNSMYGVHQSKQLRYKSAQLMKLKGVELISHIALPEAAPQIANGVKTSLSLALIVVIVTELLIGTHTGLGKRITTAQQIYDIEAMYAAIILTGIIGYLLNLTFVKLERKTFHWIGK